MNISVEPEREVYKVLNNNSNNKITVRFKIKNNSNETCKNIKHNFQGNNINVLKGPMEEIKISGFFTYYVHFDVELKEEKDEGSLIFKIIKNNKRTEGEVKIIRD